MIKHITKEEREMITNYIDWYAAVDDDGNSCGMTTTVNLDNVLSTWAKNKKNLFDLFDNQFILKKEIDYQKSINQVADIIFGQNDIVHFLRKFKEEFWDIYHYNLEYDWICYEITASRILAENTIGAERIFNHPETGEVIKIAKGMKATKAIKKLMAWCKEDLSEEYEAFRLKHSQILNDKKLKGTLCLSIHPLDYMTMSDNASRWNSCMSWRSPGGYRAGTVECMNSTNTIVAYIENPNAPFTFGDNYEWNNKMWRCLFVVDSKAITSVKCYPYHNDDIIDIVINWLKEIVYNKTGNEFGPIGVNTSGCIEFNPRVKSAFNERRAPYIYFDTAGCMYNDFGCAANHHYSLNTAWHAEAIENGYNEDVCVVYTSPMTCMCCGRDFDPDYEGVLLCDDCFNPRRCDCCGCVIGYDHEHGPSGEHYCRYCFDEICCVDEITDELIYNDDSISLLVNIPDVNESREFITSIDTVRTYSDTYFLTPPTRNDESWSYYYETTPDNLTENFFDSPNVRCMLNFMRMCREYKDRQKENN
jgi:hypothetical protein